MKNYEYSLWIHWKQDDDLANYLESYKNDAKKALLGWAQSFRDNARRIRELVNMFEGKSLTVPMADTHGITLGGDIETLEKAVKKKLISKYEIEDY